VRSLVDRNLRARAALARLSGAIERAAEPSILLKVFVARSCTLFTRLAEVHPLFHQEHIIETEGMAGPPLPLRPLQLELEARALWVEQHDDLM
jgi:hypothetical protein